MLYPNKKLIASALAIFAMWCRADGLPLPTVLKNAFDLIPLLYTNGLVADWRYDDTSVSRFVDTVGGNTMTGAVSVANVALDASAKVGYLNRGAIALDGSQTLYGTAANAYSFMQQTWSLWIKPSSFANQGGQVPCIIYQSDNLGNNEDRLLLGANAGIGYINYGTAAYQFSLNSPGGVISSSAWTHVCCTKNLTNAAIYINGVQVASSNYTYTARGPCNMPFAIGAYPPRVYPNAGHYSGSIDDLMIYTNALSSQQVYRISHWW